MLWEAKQNSTCALTQACPETTAHCVCISLDGNAAFLFECSLINPRLLGLLGRGMARWLATTTATVTLVLLQRPVGLLRAVRQRAPGLLTLLLVTCQSLVVRA